MSQECLLGLNHSTSLSTEGYLTVYLPSILSDCWQPLSEHLHLFPRIFLVLLNGTRVTEAQVSTLDKKGYCQLIVEANVEYRATLGRFSESK